MRSRSSILKVSQRVKTYLIKNLIWSTLAFLVFMWGVTSWLVLEAEKGAPGSNISSISDALWWGIVTFLTVGYGDRYPVTQMGRFWAGTLMFNGVFGIAIITSKISSYFMEQVLREGRGIVDTSKLKGHFIICGWKEEMPQLINHILDFNPDLESKDIVMISEIHQREIDSIRQHRRLKDLKVITGDFAHKDNIERAAPERAKKVLILADRTPLPNGSQRSVTEVDARTIMTAMTLANIDRRILIAAEILEPNMDQYLRMASVNEIIHIREYSRLLLGNASSGTGVSNIIFELLDPRNPTFITTLPLSHDAFGQSYQEYRPVFERNNPGTILIGILENTGNAYRIKELALRQAQKTPDMGRLVQNLRAVKDIRCNHPVFNPEPKYIIQEGSMAITIETREITQYESENARAG